MFNQKDNLTYFLYARKSDENEDRQMQSIEDQEYYLTELAQKLGLTIKERFSESRSAKKPFNRPVYKEMIERIRKGEANGILVWEINRLSRNPFESGELQWLLLEGVVQCIQTINKRYLPEDNVLLYSVESAMATQYSRDLSRNCRRGMESKARKGWKPGMAPLGYLNVRKDNTNTIIADKTRFHQVRQMWEMLIAGNHSVPQIHKIAVHEWGLTSVKKKRVGGGPVSLSALYGIFSNPFYAGMFEWTGTLYEGNHKAMITLEEYDAAQVMLGRKEKQRPKTHEFAFTGMIKCECGSTFTASEKLKLLKKQNKFKSYTYYHCSKKKKGSTCRTTQTIKLSELEEQIEKEIEKYIVPPEFAELAMDFHRKSARQDIDEVKKLEHSRKAALLEAEKELENLTRMRYRELIDDKIFMKESAELKTKIVRLSTLSKQASESVIKIQERVKRAFNYAAYARGNFRKGTIQEKREILSMLGSNFLIKDRKLFIKAPDWLIRLKEFYEGLLPEFKWFELRKRPENEGDKERFESFLTVMLTMTNEVGRILESSESEPKEIPELDSTSTPENCY